MMVSKSCNLASSSPGRGRFETAPRTSCNVPRCGEVHRRERRHIGEIVSSSIGSSK